MIDIHDDEALIKAAVAMSSGGDDPGFGTMLSGEASRELAERALVYCMAMALSGALNGSADAVIISSTRLLAGANSRAAVHLWERIADDFVSSRKWDEGVMLCVGNALAASSTWSGWASVLHASTGDDCKQLARGVILSCPPKMIGASLYSCLRHGKDKKLFVMAKERFGARIIGSSVTGMSDSARNEVKSFLGLTDEEEAEFDDGVKSDAFGVGEEAEWKPLSALENPRGNAKSAGRASRSFAS